MLARMTGASSEHIAAATANTNTTNGKLKRHFPDIVLRHPTVEHGLGHVRQFWKSIPATRHLVKN
jgi:hypothetical protein